MGLNPWIKSITQYCHTIHRYAIELFISGCISPQGEPWREKSQCYSSAPPLPRLSDTPSTGTLICLPAAFVLYCYWWHSGVTVKWVPPTLQPAAAQPETMVPQEPGGPRRPSWARCPNPSPGSHEIGNYASRFWWQVSVCVSQALPRPGKGEKRQ